jgi:5-formyltetrahydrofolate cyclo-ligase
MNNENKNDFRQNSIIKLKKCSKRSTLKKDKQIVKQVLAIIESQNVKRVLLFIPLKIEVDIRSLFLQLKKKKYKVFVPFMVGKSLKVVPYRLPLKKKKYNILEPNNSNIGKRYKLDLAIVPVVGIDKKLKRIGYGAGFYDRFFDSLNYELKKVFIQRTLCFSNKVLSEKHDIKADWIVTDKGILR